VLSFPPAIAPTKVLIVPLSSNKEFTPLVSRLSQQLRALHIACRVDDSSATIGKRYSRNDEIGTPLGITIDFQTTRDGTVTLRDRDSMKQVRADVDSILLAVKDIVDGVKTWSDVTVAFPLFTGQDGDIVD
jgi:glycyl-tRNA synthetase